MYVRPLNKHGQPGAIAGVAGKGRRHGTEVCGEARVCGQAGVSQGEPGGRGVQAGRGVPGRLVSGSNDPPYH